MTLPVGPRGPLLLAAPERVNRLGKPGGVAEDARPPLWAWKMRWSQRFLDKVPIVVIGDSIEFGSNTATVPEYTWVGRLGYILRGDRHYSQLRGGIHYRANQGGWTTSGTIVNPSAAAYDLGLDTVQIGNTAYMERTNTCTGWELYFTNGGGTTGFTVHVDGVLNMTVNTSPLGGKRADGFMQVGPFTRGSHTIRLTATGNSTFFNGMYAFDDDAGIGVRVYNAGRSGAHSVHFANQAGFNANMARLARLDPALVILALGTNDYGTGITPTAYKTNMQEIIQWLEMNTGPFTSILLLHKYRRLDVGSPTYSIDLYKQAMREISANFPDIDFLDISQHFPATSDGDFYNLIDDADNVHPTTNGHSFIADLVADHLLKPLSERSAPLGTPSTITTTAPSALSGVLAAWRQADLPSAGSNVSSWATYAGTRTQALVQATTGNQPLVQVDGTISNKRYATFTNVSAVVAGTYLQTTAWASKQDPPLTIAMVCRRNANLGYMFSGRTSGAWVSMYAEGADSEMLTFAAAGSLSSPAPAGFWCGTDAWNVYCLVVNAASSKLFQNGRVVQTFTMSTVAQNAAAGLQGVTLGGRYDGVNSFSGDVAEFIVYSRALTDSEAQGVVDYWARQYGLDRANRTSAAA
jgi:lysophospholipase L1-like esterase